MRTPKFIRVLVNKIIVCDRVDPICCHEQCPFLNERYRRERRNPNYGYTTASCSLSQPPSKRARPLRQSIYKKWRRTPVCLNAESTHRRQPVVSGVQAAKVWAKAVDREMGVEGFFNWLRSKGLGVREAK
jgi:hypothetical protein